MTRKRVCATDKSVWDLSQQAIIEGDTIHVVSRVGKQKAGEYTIPLAEWQATLTRPTANPHYNRRELIRTYTEHYDEEPGGPDQAERIRDSQVRAIITALDKLLDHTSGTV
jgi:hypothetical protein